MEEKHYLTREGLEKIKRELKKLKEKKMAKVKEEIPRSFRFGETEAEDLTFQEEMIRLEEEIAQLEDILKNYQLIEPPQKREQDKVYLGARVTVELDGEIEEFKIVGTLESDPANQRISVESPIGKALLGKRVGEEFEIKTPMVNHICRILKIKYGSD